MWTPLIPPYLPLALWPRVEMPKQRAAMRTRIMRVTVTAILASDDKVEVQIGANVGPKTAQTAPIKIVLEWMNWLVHSLMTSAERVLLMRTAILSMLNATRINGTEMERPMATVMMGFFPR
jgi:hypothetical protein